MQQDADFIIADFLYMFRASSAHHQEYKKILTRQPPVQVVIFAGRSSRRHIRDETVSSLI
jgi:ATP:corrinoid adenosyltransferase